MTTLYYFDKGEFGQWQDKMSCRLLVMLDVFRHLIDSPVSISDHPSSLGRYLGKNSQSAHNVDVWGEVLAVDCFVDNAKTSRSVQDIVDCAIMLGFTGIGIYPEWVNNNGELQCGFHLDIRPTRKPGDPAKWGYVGGKFTDIKTALAALDDRDNIRINNGWSGKLA
jgi:hypothetical protein